MKIFQQLAMVMMLARGLVLAAGQDPAAPSNAKATSAKGEMSKPSPTAKETAEAKAKGLVWVNTKAKVFHKAGSEFYGKTAVGEFMTEEAAIKAGNRLAKAFQPKIGKRPARDSKAAEGKQ